MADTMDLLKEVEKEKKIIEKDEKIIRKNRKVIVILVVFLVLVLGLVGVIINNYSYRMTKYTFLNRLGAENYYIKHIFDANKKYLSEKVKYGFLLLWAMIDSESLGNANMRSKNRNGTTDYGLMGINSCNIDNVKHALRHEFDRSMQSVSIYEPKLNIYAGALLLREKIYYFEIDGWADKDALFNAIECYNMGFGNWRKGYDNSKYLDKVMIRYVEYCIMWEEYKKPINIIKRIFVKSEYGN